MLTTRNGFSRSSSRSAYVCISCRSKLQRRAIYEQSTDRNPTSNHSSRRNEITSPPSSGHFTSEKASKRGRHEFGKDLSTWPADLPSKFFTISQTWSRSHASAYHTSSGRLQQAVTAATHFDSFSDLPPPTGKQADRPDDIRARLHQWNELHGHAKTPDPVFGDDIILPDEVGNTLSRLPDEKSLSWQGTRAESWEIQGHQGDISKEGSDETSDHQIFLKMGDLVEIPFVSSERESTLAVFVRRVSGMAQCYTMNGRWIHTKEEYIPYSIPDWIAPKFIEPMLAHLPDAKDLEDREALAMQSTMEDLSIPRYLAAPVVSRLVAFHNECQDIYRKHATALDAAHDILAHPRDLRYGSLMSAAATLLKIPSDELPLSALFTVRKAIHNTSFGFNVDLSSHRLTGYMQILSKEQVQGVERVRNWLREWQDDAARSMGMTEKQRARHKPSEGAQIINSYVEKARAIIRESRKTRSPTMHGTVGPSSVRLPITPTDECVRVTAGEDFTPEEQEITKFMEAWSTSLLFTSNPRLAGMPPLLLQAVGMYPDMSLVTSTGHVFLQEIGALMPYENRERFDTKLLLPTSQHSRPLQILASKLDAMEDKHGFTDSMAALRHDWKDMSVYCIDRADAQEIDDGVSVERAGKGADGSEHYWLHIHVANPTAYFSRDHPIAKMARHMGETVYTPERPYPMLPKWVSTNHFSLDKDRPCLTMSAKVDENGNTLERKITSGRIRNAISVTPDEIDRLLGASSSDQTPTIVLRVGGELPPRRKRKSPTEAFTTKQVEELQLLQRLAMKRFEMRKAAGGIFFDIPRPDVQVWQRYRTSGLAWHHPHRVGRRTVEGDPVIEYRTPEFRNWFDPRVGTADTVVREMMLLACETAAKWCAERNIPVVYRGTTHNPDGLTPSEFRRDVLIPSVGEDGEIPMHLGLKYMKTLGPSILSTSPVPHEIMGMQHYSKVTSPLRRYGDMILHWQIEAAMRHEAETGRSLIDQPKGGRSFLPFSAPVLDIVLRGLRPRERTVMLAKRHTERFWWLMLLMRKHVFNEDGGFPYKTLRMLVTSDPSQGSGRGYFAALCLDVNIYFQMEDPNTHGLGKAKEGDVWECTIGHIDVYMHVAQAVPVRLLERPNA